MEYLLSLFDVCSLFSGCQVFFFLPAFLFGQTHFLGTSKKGWMESKKTTTKKNPKTSHTWKYVYSPFLFDWKNHCILGCSWFSQNFEGIPLLASSFQGCFWKVCHSDFHCLWAIFFFHLSLKAFKVFSSLVFWSFTMTWVWLFSHCFEHFICTFHQRTHVLNFGKLPRIILLLISSTWFFSFLFLSL